MTKSSSRKNKEDPPVVVSRDALRQMVRTRCGPLHIAAYTVLCAMSLDGRSVEVASEKALAWSLSCDGPSLETLLVTLEQMGYVRTVSREADTGKLTLELLWPSYPANTVAGPPMEQVREVAVRLSAKWNEVAMRHAELPKVLRMTGARLDKLRARLNDTPEFEALCVDAISRLPIDSSGWSRKWQPSIDWLLRNSTNVVKLLEGTYGSGAVKPQNELDQFL